MTTNRVPPTDSTGRPHVLDGTCWCKPVATTAHGRSTLEHHAAPPTPPATAELQHIVRTPPKRSRWGRPWDRRRR